MARNGAQGLNQNNSDAAAERQFYSQRETLITEIKRLQGGPYEIGWKMTGDALRHR
jgi:hypothetical protein